MKLLKVDFCYLLYFWDQKWDFPLEVLKLMFNFVREHTTLLIVNSTAAATVVTMIIQRNNNNTTFSSVVKTKIPKNTKTHQNSIMIFQLT